MPRITSDDAYYDWNEYNYAAGLFGFQKKKKKKLRSWTILPKYETQKGVSSNLWFSLPDVKTES